MATNSWTIISPDDYSFRITQHTKDQWMLWEDGNDKPIAGPFDLAAAFGVLIDHTVSYELDAARMSITALEKQAVELTRDRDRYFEMKRFNAGEHMRERNRRQELEHTAHLFVNRDLTETVLHELASLNAGNSIVANLAQNFRELVARRFGVEVEDADDSAPTS